MQQRRISYRKTGFQAQLFCSRILLLHLSHKNILSTCEHPENFNENNCLLQLSLEQTICTKANNAQECLHCLGLAFSCEHYIVQFVLSWWLNREPAIYVLICNVCYGALTKIVCFVTDGAVYYASWVLQSRENIPSVLWAARTAILHDQQSVPRELWKMFRPTIFYDSSPWNKQVEECCQVLCAFVGDWCTPLACFGLHPADRGRHNILFSNFHKNSIPGMLRRCWFLMS